MKDILVNSLIKKLLFDRRWWVVRHLLFWIFIYLDEFLALIGITESYDEYLTIGISLIFDVIVVYVNIYVLYPLYLKKGRLAEYIIFTMLSLSLLVFGEFLMDRYYWGENETHLEFFIHVFTISAISLASGLSVKILKNSIRENELRKETEKEKLSIELQHLKKQVNPHFLFNVLNGIYIQSQTEHEKVPDTIMQLSDLLRYQIYDAEKSDRISLGKELEFIKNYIALEQMRREHTAVELKTDIENLSFPIEPLLFIVLIENAFKYSVPHSGENSKVLIHLKQLKEKLTIIVENSIGIAPNSSEEESGLGLENLKRRLEFIYPDSHSFEIDTTKDGIFSTKLEISSDGVYHRR